MYTMVSFVVHTAKRWDSLLNGIKKQEKASDDDRTEGMWTSQAKQLVGWWDTVGSFTLTLYEEPVIVFLRHSENESYVQVSDVK